ncbi:helix-turn-helix domain-containing protein [Gordonia sp. ABSL1-1]|uniref:TetR/AcrR family transcriptional regulator n=1 Tax=Gordonia sp. ABSL1-1 TaxID=3053923 RepID=UPI00257425F3|nr:TetR/AcrR family transcriptional regulator [Gordonia sp. ABSL1-1]MDL9936135.1 helix-turn-helix domain-containing protein [Gordonia sp. ABSL1-1]
MSDWLADDRAELASARILDIAGALFEEHGVRAVTMRDVARAAGCSRPTLYRYFPGRTELLAAYVERAATALAGTIADADSIGGPVADRLLAAIRAALTGVRANPALAAWFTPDAAGQSAHLALFSPAIEQITRDYLAELVPDATEEDRRERARWLVRIIVSFLGDPASADPTAADPTAADDTEDRLLRRFVLPVILDA